MLFFRNFHFSSIGTKVWMALTGLIIFGFVIGHMAGNLQVFAGQETYNAYAHFLKHTPLLLWGTRVVLLASVIIHITTAITLTLANRAARPIAYTKKSWRKASFASRTMMYSGSVVLAFIIYHLAHFTLGLTNPEHFQLVDAAGRQDVYSMFVLGFQKPVVAMFYAIANILLGLHLNHGASSMFQTLGFNHPKYQPFIDKIGPVTSTMIVLGNLSMPLAVQLGFITLPLGVA